MEINEKNEIVLKRKNCKDENCTLCNCGPNEGCSDCPPKEYEKQYAPTGSTLATADSLTLGGTTVSITPEVNINSRVMDDSKTATRLLQKNWSPLIVRKYQMRGWPLYISLITDANLSDLDKIVYEIDEEAKAAGYVENDIQSARNYTGYMSDRLIEHYGAQKRGCVEGVAVLYYVDKCFISSLWGDLMTHAACKAELFQIVGTLAHI